jgi:hypothetical protein
MVAKGLIVVVGLMVANGDGTGDEVVDVDSVSGDFVGVGSRVGIGERE